MFKLKTVSSLEKAFIDDSINKFEELDDLSVLKGERFSLQLLSSGALFLTLLTAQATDS